MAGSVPLRRSARSDRAVSEVAPDEARVVGDEVAVPPSPEQRDPVAARLGPSLVTGSILGVLETLLAISLGGLVFAGAMSAHVGVGIGMGLFAGFAMMVGLALFSSLSGTIGSVQDVTAAVLAVVAVGVVSELGPDDPRLLGTVILAVAMTTLATGIVLWVLGALRLGQLGRFVPYPVVGGFLAGTGWLLVTGGVGLLAGGQQDLGDPALWLAPPFLALVVPGIALAVGLLLGTRRWGGAGLVPAVCLAAIAAFYAIVLLGPGISVAEAGGWLLGPFPEGALWPPDPAVLTRVAPGAILAQLPGMLTVVVLSAVALLLNVSGTELSTGQDADLNRELRVAGLTNVVASAGAGLPGFHALSLTNLAHRAGAANRTTGLVAATVLAVTLVFSGDIVALAPRPVVGGLLVFIGLAFLVEWLVDGWSRLRRADYAVVVLIVVVIAAVGFLEGVAVGLLATIGLFLVAYSRADVVRHTIGGDAYPSQVERPPGDAERLRAQAHAITILELQGFLFFGTATRLLDLIRERLDDRDEGMGYLVMDLRHVTGLDSSTVLSFQRAAQLALRHDATIVLSGLRGAVDEQVRRSELAAVEGIRVEVELDRAVQWCEDQLLARDPDRPDTRAATLRERLVTELGGADLADRLLTHLSGERFTAGDTIISQGDRSRELFFLESGLLTVVLRTADEPRRLRTMMAGTVVGEVGMYLGVPRSASVVAETDVVVSRLSGTAMERLSRDDPALAAALHQLLARHLAARLAATLRTIEAFGD